MANTPSQLILASSLLAVYQLTRCYLDPGAKRWIYVLMGKPAVQAVAAASATEKSTVGKVRNSVNKPANQPAEHSL